MQVTNKAYTYAILKTQLFNKRLLGNIRSEGLPRALKHMRCLRNNTLGVLIFTHNLSF